jgi:hypothetical protein
VRSADIRRIALAALLDVAADPASPAAARAGAGRTLLEAIGDLGRGSVPVRDRELASVDQLSADELHEELARLRASSA